MKKITLQILLLFIIFSSCTDEKYEQLNINPNEPTTTSSGSLFVSATKSLVDQMTSLSVNRNHYRFMAQYVAQRNFASESNYDLVNRSVPLNHWSEMYRDILLDLQDAKIKIVEENLDAGITANRNALIEILSVYAWQQMVDTFGDIPYTNALQGIENIQPTYEDAETIYNDLFVRLNAAIAMLDSGVSFNGESAFGGSDIIYGDDITSWRKFANSLKLRLAIRVVEFPAMATLAQTSIQEAVASGVFTSNADNFSLTYEATPPNTNPMWETLVESGRPPDYFPSNTIVDYMNTLDDPRRSVYFRDNITDGSGDVIYVGGIYGTTNSIDVTTRLNETFREPTFRGILLDYSEVSFMLAQATELGISVGGDAATHYTNGITANMQDWGVDQADITSYLAQTDVAYATAAGTWKEKLGLQYWLAMYNRGFEGWTVWRQLDAPALNIPVDTSTPVPVRYTYPVEEQLLNSDNYTSASTAIGGDTQQTKIFWDVN